MEIYCPFCHVLQLPYQCASSGKGRFPGPAATELRVMGTLARNRLVRKILYF